MAARKALQLAERQARGVRPLPALRQRIGQWRVSKRLAPSSSGYGPLRDLPDWSFVDGRPAPPWQGQVRRHLENQALVQRVLTLSQSLDRAAQPRELAGAQTPRLRPKGSQSRPVQTKRDQ